MKKQLAVLLLSLAFIVDCSSEKKEDNAKNQLLNHYNNITKMQWRNANDEQIVSFGAISSTCSKHNANSKINLALF